MLANKVGLSEKYESENHFHAKKKKKTAGQAAKIISKDVSAKISARELVGVFRQLKGRDPEWHHAGFYTSLRGKTRMGRTFFFGENEIKMLTEYYRSRKKE